jgi:hypothetical protein
MQYNLIGDVEKTFGFIAQEIQNEFPYLVKEINTETKRLVMDYDAMSAAHHEWIRVVDKRSEATEQHMESLVKRVEGIESSFTKFIEGPMQKTSRKSLQDFFFYAENLSEGALRAKKVGTERV